MKNKYLILYFVAFIFALVFFMLVDRYSKINIEYQQQILLKQAQTHFFDQVNTRKWNAQYGGIYVKPTNGLEANKYLKNNILKVDDNLTLIKINPAWMTRQLSEQSNMKSFHFRITSLKPINPENIASPFEKKALTYFERTGKDEYYEIGSNQKFNYMGSLKVDKSCMQCHSHQGYKIGDIRGGISVILDASDYFTILSSTTNRIYVVKFFILFFLLSIVFLIHKLFKNNEELNKKVTERTYELEYEKNYIHKILDENPNIIIVTNGMNIINANKRFFDFFDYKTIESFQKKHNCVCEYFTFLDDEKLTEEKKIGNKIWYEYLLENPHINHIVRLNKKKEVYEFVLNAVYLNNNDILLTMQDVTELKQKDKLLYKSEKMASMGEMIGNIAHQWRQPLSVISTGVTGMQMEKEYGLLKDEMFYKTCESINDNAQYLSRTIDDFRSFINNDGDNKLFALQDNINSFLHLVEGTIKENDIELILDIQNDIKIQGYENQLTQCLINIFNNAKDALLTIDAIRYIFISSSIESEKVVLRIKDNAGGIKEDILPKIFEPYFTTKHKSQGTGLGLHMTYNLIVDGMNGSVEAINKTYKYNNKEYTGIEFIIVLPKD